MTTRQIVINVPESVLQAENTDADTFLPEAISNTSPFECRVLLKPYLR